MSIERELELENEAVLGGVGRYWDVVESRGHSETHVGQRLIALLVESTSPHIGQYIADAKKVDYRSPVTYLGMSKPSSLALLTSRAVVQGVSQYKTATTVANLVGSLIREHLEWQRFYESEKPLAAHISKETAKATTERHRRAVARHAVERFGDPLDWTPEFTIRVGAVLVELVCLHSGLVEKQTHFVSRKKKRTIVTLTNDAKLILEFGHIRAEDLSPIWLPMVCSPKPWTAPTEGGYWRRRLPLVKGSRGSYLDELEHADMPVVYDALNALQMTPWRINRSVLHVFQQAYNAGDQLALPARQDKPLPAKPTDIETNDIARKEWRIKAARTYDHNARLVSKRVAASAKLSLAERFEQEEAIYFPHSLDWRGRAYPIPVGINPQADDLGKALIHFANGKPLGKDGANWLAIHVANLFGVDKVSYVGRMQWVVDHTEEILDSAMDPLDGKRFWLEAADPWQALAACFEWFGYMVQGAEYVSHLPISMDGSCNGLQHFSAMLRDEIGGHATNLTASEEPQDIYQIVADRVTQRLEEESDERAAKWLEHVSRQIVKRPVMTLPYGATRYGMRDQILKEVRKHEEDNKGPMFPGSDGFRESKFLGDLVYDCIGDVVIAARDTMDWLQDSARVAAQADLPIWWTTPSGLPVCQDYRKRKGKRVEAWVGSQRITLQLQLDTSALNAKRQALGIAPNFVHSLDSAHMMLTVSLCLQEGITDFAMVHDSYGVHACDAGEMAAVLRSAFVIQYEEDVLQKFREELLQQLPEELAAELPPVPPSGNLDLGVVQDSLYFFA